MKILLINPYHYYASGINEATKYPPIGLIYIAAVLEKHGHKPYVIDANMMALKNEKIIEKISSFNPEMIGISANIINSRAAIELCYEIRKRFKKIKIVCGGTMPTTLPGKFLKFSDIVVRGEGEKTMLELVNRKPLSKIDGISYKINNRIVHTKSRKLLSEKELNELPFPAYNLMEPDIRLYKSRARKTPSIPIITSRGCPFNCIFCNKNIFGHAFRARYPENVIKEIDWLVHNYGARQIDILDDNFTLDLDRAEKICDLIIKKSYRIFINCQNGIRADRITNKLAYKMKKAGVFKVGMGIESGNLYIQKKIRKNLKLKDVERAITLFKKHKILVHGLFMLGLPGDNPDTMQDTVDFALKADPNIAIFNITIPFPGTDLYIYVEKNGRFLQDVEKGIFSGFYGGMVFYETEKTKKEDVINYYKMAHRKFYMKPRKIFDIVSGVRSWEELKWIIGSSLEIIRSVK